MNFIDAIKSGKSLRRRGRSVWSRKSCHGEHSTSLICDSGLGHWMSQSTVLELLLLDEGDVTATDWEIHEPTKTITRTQYWDAVSRALNNNPSLPITIGYSGDILDQLATELGFEVSK